MEYENLWLWKWWYISIKKRNGYIIEYDCKGKLLFEEQFLDGEKNGKGKEFNECDILKIEG